MEQIQKERLMLPIIFLEKTYYLCDRPSIEKMIKQQDFLDIIPFHSSVSGFLTGLGDHLKDYYPSVKDRLKYDKRMDAVLSEVEDSYIDNISGLDLGNISTKLFIFDLFVIYKSLLILYMQGLIIDLTKEDILQLKSLAIQTIKYNNFNRESEFNKILYLFENNANNLITEVFSEK